MKKKKTTDKEVDKRKPWTNFEVNTLKKAVKNHKTIKEGLTYTSKTIGRSYPSCRLKWHSLKKKNIKTSLNSDVLMNSNNTVNNFTGKIMVHNGISSEAQIIVEHKGMIVARNGNDIITVTL